MRPRRRPLLLISAALVALASLGTAAGVSAQDATTPGAATPTDGMVRATSPDGLVTVYVPGDALPPGVQLAIKERSPDVGPRELRGIDARTVIYRLTPRDAEVNMPITIVRRYRSENLGFDVPGMPVISQSIKGPGGWRWLDDQLVLSAPANAEGASTIDPATRTKMADFLRRSLDIDPDAFADPFDDPTIDLVVAGTTNRLGDLIGFGGGVFVSQEPAAAATTEMSVGDRRALRGQADVSRAYGGRTTGLDFILDPPDVATIQTQTLYPDRSYAAVIGCEAEGEALALTEVTLDRLARRVSAFDQGPLARLGDGTGARVHLAHPVACGP